MAVSQSVSFSKAVQVHGACLCLHTQRAARLVARRFDAGLKRHGITSGQFSLLMSLNRPEPGSVRWVADLLAVDRTTLTAALKPLERRGLVQAKTDPSDRRGKLLSLTAEGQRVLAESVVTWEGLQAAEEGRLANPDELRSALSALR
ncbi:MarR family winged helix-turn-helix transcriptional regulator [Sphingomonas pituitosa]|nr:MarR family winged helix-turn-helix transcriptional regulator [Sphingomonas pituitosa]